MNPSSNDPKYLKDTNAAIYGAMAAAVPNATFVLQGWAFYNNPGFWGPQEVQAFLSGVPNASMLILDLFSDSKTVWDQFDSYYGKPFVWNMLQIFGGRRAVYGNLPAVAQGPVLNRTAPGSTLVGIGTTPEATEMTPVTFDLLWEMGWRSHSPDLSSWIQGYLGRRYGVVPVPPQLIQAWDFLLPGVYSSYYDYDITTSLCVLEDAPQLTYDPITLATRNPDSVVAALRLYLQAVAAEPRLNPATNAQLRYDLVDLGRQLACDVGWDLAVTSGAEFLKYMNGNANTTAQTVATTRAIRRLISSLDALLSTDVNYLLGTWLADAQSWAAPGNSSEAQWLGFNARNQITLWGPNGEINDYAAKNGWAGLVGDYYGGRWALHSDVIVGAVTAGTPVDWKQYESDLSTFERSWGGRTDSYPVTPSGDTLQAVQQLVDMFASGDVSAFTFAPNTTVTAAGAAITTVWHRDVPTLLALCQADPGCAAVSTGGVLFASAAGMGPSASVGLYVKN